MTFAVLFPALLLSTGPVAANPSGGVVVHGDVSIVNGGNGLLNINQNSSMAIINWSDFNIAADEITRFNQPGVQAAVLNRVTGGDPSAIFGALQGNGNVFVINPNGILVGPTGMIDVHGLVLSTLDVTNGEFLAGGDMTFLGRGEAGVVNMGRINAIGGDVFLFGNTVTNEGAIVARDGTVGIGAGREVLLAAKSNTMGERVFVRAGGSGSTGILNTGSIEGAAVELKAHGNMYALAINNKGSIRAVGAVNQGGRAFLRGMGGSVSNSGSIEVTSSSSSYAANRSASAVIEAAYARVDGATRAEGGSVRITGSDSVDVGGLINVSAGTGKGGDVTIEAQNVAIGGTAVIDASGLTGGGSVRVGGGIQGRDSEVMNADLTTVAQGALFFADATESGDGGSVVLWADGDTKFEGAISATGIERGGFAEISGKRNLNIDGSSIDLGQGGFLLLDPSNFTVTDTVRNTIRPTLNAGSDVVIFTNGSDTLAGNGDIIFSGLNAIDGLGGSATTGSLSLLAYGDIFMRRDLINNGTGNVNLVAGWDGLTPSDFSPGAAGTNTTGAPVVLMDSQIFADTSTYGNRNGSVYIGLETDKVTPTNVSTITVASRNGETNVAGYNLVMVGDNTAAGTGDNRWVQLGYRPGDVDATFGREAATGRIKVNVLNDITMTAGIRTNAGGSPSTTPAQTNFVQIGHGGSGAGDNGFNHAGAIELKAGLGKGVGITGDIVGTGGANLNGFVHVGHGGTGGANLAGSFGGDITVEAGSAGSVRMTAGTGRRSYAQIGHGGFDVDAGLGVGYHMGEITVRAGKDIIFTGGTGQTQFITDSYSYAMIGHGGALTSSLSAVQGHNGSITVQAGAGGVSGAIDFKAGDLDDNFVQLGHGGLSSGANGNVTPAPGSGLGHHGLIEVSSTTGDISFFGGDTGLGSAGDGFGRLHYAQLGHGGYTAAGDHSGSIIVEATTGSIRFTGGATTRDVTDGIRNSAQLGHGGFDAAGAHNGNVVVRAGNDILFQGSNGSGSVRGYAQLGHGGLKEVGSTDSVANLSGSITLSSGIAGIFNDIGDFDMDMAFDDIDFVQGSNANGIRFLAGSGTTVGGGEDAYAQLGHGGRLNRGEHDGDIDVDSGSQILFQSGAAGARTYAQLGHGGHDAAVLGSGPGTAGNSGDINVNAATNLDFRWGATTTVTSNETYIQLGHGGYVTDLNAGGDNDGDITVTANNLLFRGTTGATSTGNYVQLGNGGLGWTGNHSGDIAVTATGTEAATPSRSIAFFGSGSAADRYIQLGHGGSTTRGDHSGDIAVNSPADIVFTGGTGLRGYAMVGHGGHDADSHNPAYYQDNVDGSLLRGPTSDERIGNSGTIRVETIDGSVLFTAGTTTSTQVQIGHGGSFTDGDHVGNITVIADADKSNAGVGGDIIFRANTAGTLHSAQIGHGGFEASGGHTGDIVATAGGAITFTAGSTSNSAQIGHGGVNDHRVTRTGTTGNFVQTNNNDLYYPGTHSGSVTVEAGTDISFTGGSGTAAFAQIGHGGYRNAAEAGEGHNGAISVIGGGLINFTSLNGTSGFVQIGHGGYESFGNHGYKADGTGSDILVDGGTGVIFTAGTGSTNYAQIGHGGVLSALSSTLNIQPEEDALAANASTTTYHLNTPSVDPLGMSGNITVLSGTGVSVLGGAGNDTFAMIGLGGLTSTGARDANILVETSNGNIVLTGGAGTTVDDAFAQIGNGGAQTTSNTQGNIKVRADNGDVILTAGGGQVGTTTQTANYVQIGHGGHENIGNHGVASDTIAVLANHIVLNGGTTVDEAYAQIGNGGFGSNGNHAGSIQIDASGDLTVRGGTRVEAYALVGHGGVRDTFLPANTNSTTGNRTGNILANVGGTASLVDQTTIGFMGHLGTTGVTAGSRLTLVTGQLDTTASLRKTTGMIQNMIAGGNVEIGVTNGDLLIDGNGVFANNANEVDLFATGDVNFISSVQNAGTGLVAVVGGWDGSTGLLRTIDRSAVVPIPVLSLDADSVFADANGFGNVGSVQIGTGTQALATAVGSANGSTRVAGNSVEVKGSSAVAGAAAQIGFNEEVYRLGGGANGVASTGSITVFTKEGGLALRAGSVATSAAQIGQGGNGAVSSGFSGDIVIDLGKGSQIGDLSVLGGQGVDSNGQIGHGGRLASGAKSGNITIAANAIEVVSGSGSFASAGIGSGGGEGAGSISGSIDIAASGDVSVLANDGDFALAQIGHGGAIYDGSMNSALTSLRGGGNLELRGGSGVLTSAQVGHGGPRYNGNISGTSLRVDVTDNILVSGGLGNFSYAQIGFGGYGGAGNHSGGVEVTAGNDITLNAINGPGASYVKIGHGDDLDLGVSSLGSSGNWSGDISVGAGHNLTMSNAMIGHANKVSKGIATNGITQIGVSRISPSDPLGGILTADAKCEFAGEGELRFYVPSRENNKVASSAVLNGVTYSGARGDPSPAQGDDEFTVKIFGDQILVPNEHTNELGSVTAPANASGYAFYYDFIAVKELPPIIVTPGDGGGGGSNGGEGNGGPNPRPGEVDGEAFPGFDYGSDDEEADDFQRRRIKLLRAAYLYKLIYEGFYQYGPSGESVFNYNFQNEIVRLDPIGETAVVEPPRLGGL